MTPHSVIYLPKQHDFAELTRVWEASVRATHDFLAENYITLLRHLLETQYFCMFIWLLLFFGYQ